MRLIIVSAYHVFERWLALEGAVEWPNVRSGCFTIAPTSMIEAVLGVVSSQPESYRLHSVGHPPSECGIKDLIRCDTSCPTAPPQPSDSTEIARPTSWRPPQGNAFPGPPPAQPGRPSPAGPHPDDVNVPDDAAVVLPTVPSVPTQSGEPSVSCNGLRRLAARSASLAPPCVFPIPVTPGSESFRSQVHITRSRAGALWDQVIALHRETGPYPFPVELAIATIQAESGWSARASYDEGGGRTSRGLGQFIDNTRRFLGLSEEQALNPECAIRGVLELLNYEWQNGIRDAYDPFAVSDSVAGQHRLDEVIMGYARGHSRANSPDPQSRPGYRRNRTGLIRRLMNEASLAGTQG